MFTKILIANRSVLAHSQMKQNDRAVSVSINRVPQPAQRASTRHPIA